MVGSVRGSRAGRVMFVEERGEKVDDEDDEEKEEVVSGVGERVWTRAKRGVAPEVKGVRRAGLNGIMA